MTDRSRVATRLRGLGETIFTEMSLLAAEHGAVNLGQGFPDFDGPEPVKEAAVAAIRAGHGQYARSYGIPELNRAIATGFGDATGIAVDPDREVTVTSGCTEALAASFLGLFESGDEVLVFEPYYDAYPADAALAGVTPRYVTLRPPGFRIDPHELEATITGRTRGIVVNTPHNPSGRVLDDDELAAVADVCRRHDLVAISDEVYERIVFDGEHRSLATLPGMWERTVTLSSLGKTFSLTGWKIGWAVAPAPLTTAVRSAHQFLTFATATPLQHAAVAALAMGQEYYDDLAASYRMRRDLLCEALDSVGFEVYLPEGTYFVLADHTAFGFPDDVAFTRHLVTEIGVAAIPPSAFYHRPQDGADLVRFAFCKSEGTLRQAVERLDALRRD